MNTGEKIKYYRTQLGLSAEELASSIGVSPSTIYRYENNDIANMGIDKLKLIASALHTQSYVLLGWGDDKSEQELTNSVPPNSDESNILKKYRDLDDHGKKMVDFVLEEEYIRSTSSTALYDEGRKIAEEVKAELLTKKVD